MGYFTYRSHKPRFSRTYTSLNISLLREWTGNAALPVHAIGGLARDASPAQVRAFVGAAHAGDALGSSLYDFADTLRGNGWSCVSRTTCRKQITRTSDTRRKPIGERIVESSNTGGPQCSLSARRCGSAAVVASACAAPGDDAAAASAAR